MKPEERRGRRAEEEKICGPSEPCTTDHGTQPSKAQFNIPPETHTHVRTLLHQFTSRDISLSVTERPVVRLEYVDLAIAGQQAAAGICSIVSGGTSSAKRLMD